jgi:hypothetical protein
MAILVICLMLLFACCAVAFPRRCRDSSKALHKHHYKDTSFGIITKSEIASFVVTFPIINKLKPPQMTKEVFT